MERNKLVAPVLKWSGGKRQLLGDFAELLPRKINSYCEPFIGGGALLFHLQPSKAFVNDVNKDLICVYTVIKNNVDDLAEELSNLIDKAKDYEEILEKVKKLFETERINFNLGWRSEFIDAII